MSVAEHAIALRQEHPTMRAIEIAKELNVSRERVRQVLKRAGLATTVPAPILTKKTGRQHHPSSYLPTVVAPTYCPKCVSDWLYKEGTIDGDEVWCAMCGLMVAFSLRRS